MNTLCNCRPILKSEHMPKITKTSQTNSCRCNCKLSSILLKVNAYFLIYITVMYRGAKLVIFNFCTFDPFSILDEGSKNLVDHRYKLPSRLEEVYLLTLPDQRQIMRTQLKKIIQKCKGLVEFYCHVTCWSVDFTQFGWSLESVLVTGPIMSIP